MNSGSKLYNIFYRVGDTVIEKNRVPKEEVEDFLNGLHREEESYLYIKEIKEREEDER